MNVAVGVVTGILSTVLMLFLNMRGLVDGPSPSAYNFVLSVAFLVLWALLGFAMGRAKKPMFLLFTVVFWLFGLAISIICMRLTTTPLWLVSFLFLTPLNGFKYLNTVRYMFGYPLFAMYTLTPIIVTFVGYFLGFYFVRSKINSEVPKNQ